MKVSIIAAVAQNGVIGHQGKIPWIIPEDLKRFKELTIGKVVIMGRLTYESIGRFLPERINVILSSSHVNGTYYNTDESLLSISLIDALCALKELECEECFIIGGTRLYQESLDLGIVHSMYITHVHNEYVGDTYFTNVNFSQWKEVEREDFKGYSFVQYDKI